MSTVKELAASRELLGNLLSRELRGKYKRSFLGWSWSLVNPLSLAAVYTVVFVVIFKAPAPVGDPSGMKAFPLFLLTGLLPWTYLANTISGSVGSLTGNASLVNKVYFPREILVGSSTLSWVVSLAIELSVLSVVLLAFGNNVLPWLPVLVVLVALQTVFVLGVGLALSVLNVYFRDVQHFMTILLQIWFYATPVIYPISFVQSYVDRHHPAFPVMLVYRANPMVAFVESYHRVLYDLRFPTLGDFLWATVASVLSLLVGWAVFRRFEGRLAEEL
jgi:ABC-2 type transport system permease protein